MSRAILTAMLLAGAWLGILHSAVAQEAEGLRLMPSFEAGQEPAYPPGSLYFNTNAFRQSPLVYRTVWRFRQRPETAPIRIHAADFVYVWVNGRCVAQNARREGSARFPWAVDLGPYLRAGENVIAISTGPGGFALAGFADGVPLESRPADWRVWKFAPLTILENELFLTAIDIDALPSAAVKSDGEGNVRCSPRQAAAIVAAEMLPRLREQLDTIAYNSRLLAERGFAIVDDRAIGFAGVGTVPPAAIAAARNVADSVPQAQALLKPFEAAPPDDPAALKGAADAIAALQLRLDAASQLIVVGNRLTRYHLAASHLRMPRLSVPWPTTTDAAAAALTAGDPVKALDLLRRSAEGLAPLEAEIRERFGAPLNELNSAIANKAGWTDDPTLTDAVPEAWGVRFNQPQTSWFMDLAGKWRFKLDFDNTGLAQRVHEFGYNIDNQWPEITAPGYWERQGEQFQVNNPRALEQSPYPGVNVRTDGPYNGFAWYRKKVLVPAEWAGYDLELHMGAVDDYDWFYWNGEELGHTGADTNPKDFWSVPRNYRIPREKVTFGGYNVIAIRVYDCGAGGGILGAIELRCPALKESFEKKPATPRKPTTVFSSPLSPAALLTVGENELEIFGWDFRGSAGPDGIVLNINGGPQYRRFAPADPGGTSRSVVYEATREGKLDANWLLLWAQPGRPDGDLPIQLVLLSNPRSIAVDRTGNGTQKVIVDFGKPGQQILALRPVRADSGAKGPTDGGVIEKCRFWSAAALAYPVAYFELAKLADGRNDLLQVTDLYDYRTFADEWNTPPVRLAPLPPLASYGLSVNARGVSVSQAARPLGLSLGQHGELHAVVGANAIDYTAPVDTLPRLGGFTSFCFGPDVGVPGNHKEIEIMAATGANSWRPQSNDRSQRIFDTIRWTNDAGMNLTLNIDNNLGARPDAIRYWETIARHCRDLPDWAVAYDLINEPANMPPDVYNPQIKRIVEAIRAIDKTHMLLIETPHSFASIDQFVNLDPVDDPAAVYTFHDYDYRLPPRWPQMDTDIRNMLHQWLPAYRYSLKHNAPICLSEYGGFEQGNDPNNPAALVLLNDFFKVFDQFGFHHHYYSNRGITDVRADGSIQMSLVHEGYRRLFAGDTFYRFRDNWQARLREQRLAQYRDFITDWQMAGPYMQGGRSGIELFDVAFAPERNADDVRWRPLPVSSDPLRAWALDFSATALRGDNRVVYLRTQIHSPRRQEAILETGSDDGIKVWLNGELVLAKNGPRASRIADDRTKVTLREGWNLLLLKINNAGGEWAANARFRSVEGQELPDLRISATGP